MGLRVGQRVRWLHESGEGIITALLDKKQVEVDFGDGMPMEVDIDEVIPIDQTEGVYLTRKEDTARPPVEETPKVLGSRMFVVSLAVVKEGIGYSFYLMNPEPTDLVYTCYLKRKSKLEGIAVGRLARNDYTQLFQLGTAETQEIKGVYFQFINFVTGQGHPHQPFSFDLPWAKNQLTEIPIGIPWLESQGWTFPLRQDRFTQDVEKTPESDFIRIRQTDQPVTRPEPIIDLHIEELNKDFLKLQPAEILQIQLRTMEKAVSDAWAHAHPSMIIIHGVGQGILKQKTMEHLKALSFIFKTEPGDPARFGQGASRVIFKEKNS